MWNKSRCFLVALLVATQAACLGFGVAWATGWLWGAFEQAVHSTAASQGRALAHELALKTSEMSLENIQPGSSGWEQVQALCEETLIPYEGFVSVMRYDNGAMLCHPDISSDPGLLKLFPGSSLLLDDHTSVSITSAMHDAEANNQTVIQGKVELDGEVHFVTAYSLKRLNAVLAVYQSDMAINLFVISTIRPVMQVGYALTASIVGVAAILTLLLIKRYEASLAEAAAKLEQGVEQRTHDLAKNRNAVVFGLAKLTESRDRDTSIHLERMRSYVTILAAEMAKSNSDIDQYYVSDLAVASSLHDIGKIGIPDSVLLKEGPLSPSERSAMEMHTVLGGECLRAIRAQTDENDFVEFAQEIAVAHHENWDGSGYPHGLQGKDIPLSARIVALADVYDALTSTRPYKGPSTHEEARDWIATSYAEKFDPVVVEAFIAREKDFKRVLDSLPAKPYDNPTVVQGHAELEPMQLLER
ncbi:MAG: HD domain-containing protein [Planctomycetes bacterium]|nr:HD domain-containing protein [Planctomycetota bacterium]